MKPIVQGDWSIEFKTTASIEVLGKIKTFKKPITFPVLFSGQRVVMSESPQEILMMKNEAKGAKGRVLVGGLGLGIILKELRKRKSVKEIVVVERQAEVIHLYRQLRKDKVDYDEVVKTTIEEYLKRETLRPFDFIHLDTWYNGDYEHLPHVNWMVAQARKHLKPGGIVRAWTHEGMIRTFQEECRGVVTKTKSMIIHSPQYKIDVLKKTFPLLGGFIAWYRENHQKPKKVIDAKVRDLSRQSFEFQLKPEVQDEVRMVQCMTEGIPCPPSL